MATKKSTIDLDIKSNLKSIAQDAAWLKAIFGDIKDVFSEQAKIMDKQSKVLKDILELNRRITDEAKNQNRIEDEIIRKKVSRKREEKASLAGIFEYGEAPRVAIDPKTKRFKKLPQRFPEWSQPRDTGPTGQFSTGWEKPPKPGSLSDLDRLPWGPSRNAGPSGRFSAGWEKPPPPGSLSNLDRLPWGPGRNAESSGRFSAGWEKPPPPGSLSDLDRLPWGPGKDNTGSGQFKSEWAKPGGANPLPLPGLKYTDPSGKQYRTNVDPALTKVEKTFDKFDKNNQKWNELFYQLFFGGRLGQNIIRGMFSGNFIKMLGLGGIAGGALVGAAELTEKAVAQRRQALGIGGNVGLMKAAQIELARFGAVEPGLQAAATAQTDARSMERAGYRALGFSKQEIQNTDPSVLYAESLQKFSEWAKTFSKEELPSMLAQAESSGRLAAIGGDPNKARLLRDMSQEELQQAKNAIDTNAKFLDVSQKSQRALTDLSKDLNTAGTAIQTNLTEGLGKLAPILDYIVKTAITKGPSLPALLGIPDTPGGALHIPEGGIYFDFNTGKFNFSGKSEPDEPSKDTKHLSIEEIFPEIWKGRKPPPDAGLLPPLDPNIPAPDVQPKSYGIENTGGAFAIPGTSTLVKEVDDTTKSFNEFNIQLMKSSNILFSAAAIAGAKTAGGGAAVGGAAGGAAGVFGAGGYGPGGVAPVVGGAGGVAGGAAGVPGAGGAGPGATPARPAKGALAANQKEAYKAARESGLSDSSARALVANMTGEGLAVPGDVHWDSTHTARGIVQWDPERSEAIRQKFGKYPNEMSVAEQTKAAIWEIQTNPRFAETWRALQGSGTAESKIHPLVYNYEVPADKPGAESKRKGFLEALPSTLDPGTAPSPGVSYETGPSSGSVADNFIDKTSISNVSSIIGSNADIIHPAAIAAHHALMRRHRALIHHHRRHRALIHHHRRHHALIQHHRALMQELSKSELMYLETGGSSRPGGIKKPKISSEEMGKWLEAHPGGIPEGENVDIPEWYRAIQGEGGFDKFQFNPAKPEPWGNLNPFKDRPAGRYGPKRYGEPGYKDQEQQASLTTTPHLGDMSMYQQNQGVRLHVNNPAGMDIVAQTAMLGSGQGNFGA